jgi:hypothetical protein
MDRAQLGTAVADATGAGAEGAGAEGAGGAFAAACCFFAALYTVRLCYPLLVSDTYI